MKRILFGGSSIVSAFFIVTSCSGPSTPNLATGGNGGESQGSGTTSSASSSGGGAGGNAEPPGPDPACVVPDVEGVATSIVVDPKALTVADALTIRVEDAQTGHTNVGVKLCTPNGLVTTSFGGVDSGMPPFAWHWTASPLPLGTTQVIFEADPANTIHRTLRVNVKQGGNVMDAGLDAPPDPPDAPAGPTDLCNPSPGNILSHTTFEEGMSGDAPAFWQVRDPGLPNGTCLGSGTPNQHVFLTSAPPGCNGNALAVDARGQWDCYAVQLFSDYNTIQEGATYRISAAARSQGNTVNPAAWFHLGAQWLNGNDGVFGDIKNPKPASGNLNDFDWNVVWWDVVAPAGAKRIVVWLSAHYPGRVDFDNISVVKLN